MSEHQDDRDQLAKTFQRKVIVTHKSGVSLWTASDGQRVPSLTVISSDIPPVHLHFFCNHQSPTKDVMIELLRSLADKLENS